MNSIELFKTISTLIFDVDGVLTDGSVLVLENGLQARRMSTRDGYALQLAVKKGYRILIVSGAAVSPVVDRLQKLGVTDIRMGETDKRTVVKKYCVEHGLKMEEVLFMGDDIPDMEVMGAVGLSACPADAAEDVKAIAAYISPVNGGSGAVRDVIEKVLRSRNDWSHTTEATSG